LIYYCFKQKYSVDLSTGKESILGYHEDAVKSLEKVKETGKL